MLTDSYTLYKQAKEFEDQNQFEKAAEYYLKAAHLDLKNGEKNNAAFCFNKGALCLYSARKYDKALDNFKYVLYYYFREAKNSYI